MFATPDTDHEEHRQEHEFKEHEEQDQVLGDECAGHAGLQNKQQRKERLRLAWARHMIKRINNDEQSNDHAQQIKRQADAVNAYQIRTLDHRDPFFVDDELQFVGLIKVEFHCRKNTDHESCNRRNQSDEFDKLIGGLGCNHQHDDAEQWQECADTQQPVVLLQHVHIWFLPFSTC